MAYIGTISLYLAGASTVFALITSFLFLKGKKESLGVLTRQGSALSAYSVILAALSLVFAFLQNDFSIAYVARHSARNLSLIYKISALWAGQSGSLLLWLLIISILALVVQKSKQYRENDLDLRLGVVIDFVRLIFLLLLLFITPPFQLLADAPFDGSGLNPMLQSLGMVVHPPLLFIGFSGFLVPLALAVVGLLTNDSDATWLRSVGKWVLFSWLFLTAGIVSGGQWAYTELGWGGYWAWDPVENSSLFPWLTSTALLHILLLPRGYRTKRLWSYILIVVTYVLTVFSTFLTRSGILDSVHAFAGGILGQIFLGFLAFLSIAGLVLGWWKRAMLGASGEEGQSHRRLSAVGMNILVGSVLLLLLCAGVFLGTMFPVITRAFAAREVVLDASFFDQLSAPLFLAMISLMSISPLLSHKPVGVKNWVKSLALPVLLALVTVVFTYVTTRASVTTTFAFALAAFGFGTHLPSLLSPRSRRRWGGALVHLGVLVVLVGVTGSSVFVDDVLVSVSPEDQIVLGDYVLEYDGLRARYASDRYTVETTLAIMQGERQRGEITSVKTFWDGLTQPSTKVGIFSTFKEDVYLNLAGWENQTAQLHIIRFALVGWIWVGSWIMYIGTLVILLGGMSLNIKGKQVSLWAR